MNFNDLTQNQELLRAVEKMGFKEPTPIQVESIPWIREGRDFIAQSQTGTGKTAAFAIPSIEMVDENSRTQQVLVICPTRELAVQVAGEFEKLLVFKKNVDVVAVFGGAPIVQQIKKLKKKPQIVVGTPGRLRDHIRRRTVRLDDVKITVLDEADEMLKMGFAEEIEDVFDHIEHKTQNLMFSATIPPHLKEMTKKYLDDPVDVKIEPSSISSDTVEQSYVAIQRKYKKSTVSRILDHKHPKRCIIFCNTKRMVDELIADLQEKGYSADRIHGDLKQEQRIGVLNQFNKGNIDILVATDVAGRGLDIQNVDLVINYDLPEKEDSYVHRIGRSGRAGKVGEAITLVSNKDRHMLSSIQRYIKKEIDHRKVPSQKKVNDAKVEHFIEDCLNQADETQFDAYNTVLQHIREQGYSLEEVTIALLQEHLRFENTLDIDYNDHFFHRENKSRSKGGVNFGGKGKHKKRKHKKSGSKKKSNAQNKLPHHSFGKSRGNSRGKSVSKRRGEHS